MDVWSRLAVDPQQIKNDGPERSCDAAGIEDYIYRVRGMLFGFFE
jgi:hypothetical protein